MRSFIIFMFTVFFSLHCQSSGLTQELEDSVAISPDANSPLVKALSATSIHGKDKSGFIPLISGADAYDARVVLIEAAKTTLDIQYYIWHRDNTGVALMAKILNAAERGVRVRILLDDMNLGKEREVLAQLDRHPNVEIRLYNPSSSDSEGISMISRNLEIVFDYDRMNRRMHNKVIVADKSFAVLGGRNIGDEYFDLKKDKSFRDLDVLAAGPVCRDISRSFDGFWGSSFSFGFGKGKNEQSQVSGKEWEAIRTRLKMGGPGTAERIFADETDPAKAPDTLAKIVKNLVWAPARAVADSPEMDEEKHDLVQELKNLPEPKKELLIESAYFIPPESLLKRFRDFEAKGAKVRILTNSLVSNDVLLAHAGYTGKREEILSTGAELHEWRNFFVQVKTSNKGGVYASRASLHSKAFVIDRRHLFVGSMNLDPRSMNLNTETGLIIDSPELAGKIADFISEGMEAQNSWKVTLSCKQKDCANKDKVLKWEGTREGRMVTLDAEPDASFWKRFLTGGLELLPIEDAL